MIHVLVAQAKNTKIVMEQYKIIKLAINAPTEPRT